MEYSSLILPHVSNFWLVAQMEWFYFTIWFDIDEQNFKFHSANI